MNIVVFGAREVQHYVGTSPYIMIAIGTRKRTTFTYNDNKYFKDRLRINFDDVHDPNINNAFQQKHAKEIYDFLDMYKDAVDTVVIHCEAGISRSRGVATALAAMYGWEYHDDPKISWPNELVVYRMLKEFKKRTKEHIEDPKIERAFVQCNEHPNESIFASDANDCIDGVCFVCHKVYTGGIEDIYPKWKQQYNRR